MAKTHKKDNITKTITTKKSVMNRLTPLLLFMVMILSSCNKETNDYVTAFPYMETDKGKWGMITTDGEVLFSQEFKNQPTVVRNGVFLVKNEANLWEIYKAEKKPEKIGSEYTGATIFSNGRAIVCEKDKYITIIDTEGKTIKTLDEIDGKRVNTVFRFQEGYAKYIAGEDYGVIDMDGNSIIPSNYCAIMDCSDGKFIAIDKKYKTEYTSFCYDKLKYTVLNTKGEILFEIDGSEYNQVGKFKEGLLPVCVKKKDSDTEIWGIINEKQEVVIKPDEKITGIEQIRNGMFTYYSEGGWGLMSLEGKTLIKPKYNYLSFDGDNRLTAYNWDEDKGGMWFVDTNGNQLNKEPYRGACGFEELDNKHALVMRTDRSYSIIDEQYENLANLPKMVHAENMMGDDAVECNYLDIPQLLDELNVNQNGMEGVSFESTPETAVKALSKFLYQYSDEKHPGTSAFWFKDKSKISYDRMTDNVYLSVEINFYGNISYSVSDGQGGYNVEWCDEDDGRKVGYMWNDVKVKSFRLKFSNDVTMKGKLDRMLQELKKRMRKAGRVVKENSGAMVVALDNNRTALIYMQPKEIVMEWGDIGSPESLSIHEYDGVRENLSLTPDEERADGENQDIDMPTDEETATGYDNGEAGDNSYGNTDDTQEPEPDAYD